MLSFSSNGATWSVIMSLLLSSNAASALDNMSSRLNIQIPHSLYKPDGYDHREALFGIPPYGGSIAQNLYYSGSSLCDPTIDNRSGYPKRKQDENGKMLPWPTPYILMVDRGGCTFVQKVRNAQRSGAAGVVIADNTCLCSDAECTAAVADSQIEECQTSEPIMADDGSGSDITIPAFLMFKHDADKLKEQLIQGQIIQLEMTWALPSPDDRVEYDLWTTPTEFVSRDFLMSFKNIAKKLGDRAYFSPHMFIFDGTKNGCTGAGQNQCFNLCTNNGRYCAMDPDSDLDRGSSGADVIDESLRRICIWKHYGETDGVGEKWWDYVNAFIDKCNTSILFKDPECRDGAYKASKVDKDVVEQCMKDSGGLTADTTNALLQGEIEDQDRRGIVILPSAFVNTAVLRGALNANNVFGAICSGYLDGTEPSICTTCAECPDRSTCIDTGGCSYSTSIKKGGVSFHTFALSLALVGLAAAGVAYYNYRSNQREMREQVRGILAEYMPLEDQEGGGDFDLNPAISMAQQAKESLIQ